MSRTTKLFNTAANALQQITPEGSPTLRHWAVGALRAYPVRLQSELQGASRLKNFNNWTKNDLRNAFVLGGNFALFFFLGEAFGRGNLSGYPVNENPHAHH